MNRAKPACVFPDGAQPGNYSDIWHCFEQSRCKIPDDDKSYLVVFRDPRAVVVSTYYFAKSRGYHNFIKKGETVDDFALDVFPKLCQWTALRFIVFNGLLKNHVLQYWYEELFGDPLAFHYTWLEAVGLNLPAATVEAMTEAAVRRDLPFHSNGKNVHSRNRTITNERTYRDELSAETLAALDSIMAAWLPTVLLVKFGLLLPY